MLAPNQATQENDHLPLTDFGGHFCMFCLAGVTLKILYQVNDNTAWKLWNGICKKYRLLIIFRNFWQFYFTAMLSLHLDVIESVIECVFNAVHHWVLRGLLHDWHDGMPAFLGYLYVKTYDSSFN